MNGYQVILGLLSLFAIGCQQGTDAVAPALAATTSISSSTATAPATTANVRLKQMTVQGDNGGLGPYFINTRFSYKQGHLLSQVIIPPTSPNATELTNECTYDEQGRLSSYRVRYGQANSDGSVGELTTYTFGDGFIEQKTARFQANGQPLPSQTNERNIYRLNAQGQVTEWQQEGIIRYGIPTRARYVYTYENGNIVKAAYLNASDQTEFTINYQYDDKVNPFYKWSYSFDPVLYSSRNNSISAQVDQGTVYRTEYTYTEQGLPRTKKDVAKGAVLSYEYESF